ncbi:MAG: hypothetical protein QOK15_2017 [Nocardioidaceae bacterium]|nr:hypothetical protein [Nocardioidaceae bacterium]
MPTSRPLDAVPDWPCGLLESDADGLITAVNDTFLGWTGHQRADLIGRRRVRDLLTVGGRILYETHLAPLLAMQGHVEEIALDLRRADGRALPVLFNATTWRRGTDRGVRLALFAVNDRRSYEKELMEARRAAEAAGAASEIVQRRLSLMADVNLILSGTLRIDVAMQRLAALLATERRGYCVIVYRDDAEQPSVVSTALPPDATLCPTRLGRAVERSMSWSSSRPHLATRLELSIEDVDLPDFGATVIVPVRARGRHIATLVLTRPTSQAPYENDDLIEFAGLADRIGLFIDNLRLYGREHERAIAFQQALLTPPAKPLGLDIITRYLPSADDAMVGGDWYDAFIRPDGATVIVIGDVIGHDHLAAAAMGQLRGLLRSLAYAGCQPPAQLLTEVDDAARALGVSCLATVLVAVFTPSDAATGRQAVTWASAGHLPPARIAPDGQVGLLEVRADLMLGVMPGRPRRNHDLEWQPGTTLLLYTDGLVEDPSRSLDDGFALLVAALTELGSHKLDPLCDELVERMSVGQRRDDIALLAIRSSIGL